MDDYMTLQALQAFNNSLTNNANVIMAAQTSREDRKFSERMSNLAWERNLEAWRMQNEYNLPANQYQRQLEGIRANGLNPNLVYGNSSAVTGAGGTPNPYKFESYHATAVPQFRGLDSVNSLLNTRLLQTQIAAQEAQNRFINARADNEEARLPGTSARSNEQAARWQYIFNHMDDQENAWRALQSLDFWKGQQAYYNAEILKNKSSMAYIEAGVAEWLNTTNVPGLDITYRQYMERYKALLPAAQWSSFKASVLNMASQIAYRKKQGELLDLKQEYQRYVNQFAKYGRTLGNDIVSSIISGLMFVWEHTFGSDDGVGPVEYPKNPLERGVSEAGDW